METQLNRELWVVKARELFNIQQQRRELEKQETILKETLKLLNNNEPLTYSGFKYDYVIRPGTIAYDLIPELKTVDLEPYRKAPVQVWTLKVISL